MTTRWFEDAGGEAMTLVLLRALAGLAVFWVAVVALRKPLPPARLTAVGLGLGVFQLISMAGLLIGFAKAPAGLVILAFYIYPIPVVIAASLFLGEPLGWRRGVLVVAGIVGLVLAIGPPESANLMGIALGGAAGLGMSGLVLGSRYLYQREVPVSQVVALSYVLSSVTMLAAFAAGAVPLPPADGDAVASAAGFLVISSVIPVALFGLAVRNAGASIAAMLTTLEAFATVVLAFLLLGESLTLVQIAGGVLIAGAAARLSAMASVR